MDKQALPEEHMKSLGLNWQDLFNPSQAIHTNRELNLSHIKLVGFDMDYTLAVYKKRPMEQLQYRLARTFLIEKTGYPPGLSRLDYNPDLVIRGLVIDKYLGNILKVDDQNHVWRAHYCQKPLKREQIAEHYGTKRLKISDDRFYSLDTFFSVPEAGLFIDIINYFEEEKNDHLLSAQYRNEAGQLRYAQIFLDIRFAMDSIHRDGSLKSIIKDRIADFMEQDKSIAQTIRKLRREGKKIFLLTNSNFMYTDTVLSYICADAESKKSWMSLFDWIIVEASKPGFFTENSPLIPQPAINDRVFLGGNIYDFEKMAHFFGREILYVGDHIYGDILRTKKDSFWRTCLVIKELNYDIRKSYELKSELLALKDIYKGQLQADRRLMRLRTLLTLMKDRKHTSDLLDEAQTLNLLVDLRQEIKRALVLLKRLKLRGMSLNRAIEDKFHPVWGQLFKENKELSRFGTQVRQYACIYTDHVKNFLHYGANHIFLARDVHMTHEIDE